MKALVRTTVLTAVCLCALSLPAHADLIFTPFVGKTFGSQQTLTLIGNVDKKAWIIGGSAAWLTSKVLGAEVDFGYSPRFFNNQFQLLSGSNVLSLTGNVILAVPLSVTRESLRPYVTAGMGVIHAGAEDNAGVSTLDTTRLAMSVGGGAIGFLTPRAGVRFDLRHIRSTANGVETSTLLTVPQLGFWRATIGVAIRY
ncbi:MAG TPA: outer membrane beta-barrel protein [Vicinamibacterales bacterium]|nr:outer membrane beta-barrel protein [Vicinamibacterales bacterium]